MQLRSGSETVIRRTLRTLHIRGWHAQAKDMMKIIDLANMSKEVLEKCLEIVDTCSAELVVNGRD